MLRNEGIPQDGAAPCVFQGSGQRGRKETKIRKVKGNVESKVLGLK